MSGIAVTTTTVASVNECVDIKQMGQQAADECTSDMPVAPANEAGLKPGDRITEINGRSVSTWADVRGAIRRVVADEQGDEDRGRDAVLPQGEEHGDDDAGGVADARRPDAHPDDRPVRGGEQLTAQVLEHRDVLHHCYGLYQ